MNRRLFLILRFPIHITSAILFGLVLTLTSMFFAVYELVEEW